MIYKKLSLSVLLFAAGFLTASAQKSPQDMDRFIDALMNKMTLEEKARIIANRTLKEALHGITVEELSVSQEVLRKIFFNTKD